MKTKREVLERLLKEVKDYNSEISFVLDQIERKFYDFKDYADRVIGRLDVLADELEELLRRESGQETSSPRDRKS